MTNRYLTPVDKLRLGIIGLALLIISITQQFSPLAIEWASFGVPYFLMAAAGQAWFTTA